MNTTSPSRSWRAATDWAEHQGPDLSQCAGEIVSNPEREILVDMDKLPSVLPLYKQLDVKQYFGGYLLHPYMSWYTGRGCKSRCTFCLWPQTIGGHKYRFMSIDRVVQDVKYVKENFPEVREIFFDDDTLTDNHDRVEELAKALGPLNVTWSCNAKANVPRKTLEVMKANGLRLLLVGYESGNQQILHNIKKGLLVDVAKRFPATATTWASWCMAPSSWACRARRARPSRRPWPSPRKSIRTPSRCRWPRLIRAPSSTSRPRKMAGSLPTWIC